MRDRVPISDHLSRLTALVLLSGAAAWTACAPPPDDGADAAAEAPTPMATAAGAEAAMRAFADAWEAEDLEAVVATFTADGVMFDPVPPGKFSGTDGIRALAAGAFESQESISIPFSEVETNASGAVAWTTARYVYNATMDGEATAEEGYVSMVWVVQDDGSYRATLFHASPIPEAPPAAAGG